MVTELLETAIEIEGLLRIMRDGNPLPETYGLLRQKASELAERTLDLKYQGENIGNQVENSEPDTTQVDIVMTPPAETPETTEVVFSDSPAEKSISIEDDLDLSEEDDILLTFEDASESDIHQEQEEVVGMVSESETSKTPSHKKDTRLKSAFSLNDRFLYARELFGGNMKTFDSALDFIEGVDDQSIIEEYFFHELEWDPENSHVVAFMEILRNGGRTGKKINS